VLKIEKKERVSSIRVSDRSGTPQLVKDMCDGTRSIADSAAEERGNPIV
jgi:hypothetical protein